MLDHTQLFDTPFLTPEQMLYIGGVESASAGYDDDPTPLFMKRFKNLFGHLHDNIFSLFNSKFVDSSKEQLDQIDLRGLDRVQKSAMGKVQKMGFIEAGRIVVPTVAGLTGKIDEYGLVLNEYSDMREQVDRYLDQVIKNLSIFVNDPIEMRSVTMVGQLTAIDPLVKYRAKYHSKIRDNVKEDHGSNAVSLALMVKNANALKDAFDQSNKLAKILDIDALRKVAAKVSQIKHMMTLLVDVADGNSQRKPHPKVLHAISDLLYNAGTVVQDYGTYVYRVNNYILICEGIAKEIDKR